jgi:serine/threonine-protein kinase
MIRIVKLAALVAGFAIAAGASAYFTMTLIIKSEDTVIVPNLEGKDVVYALEILTDFGLNTKVKGSLFSTGIPKNHVIIQEPAPGAKIKKGRDVRIILSKGARTMLMPELIGMSVQKAGIAIEKSGLRLGNLSRTYSNTYGKEKIISHFPSPGVIIEQGVGVHLLVSSGLRSPAYIMPDLGGLSLDDAIAKIERKNLRIGEITAVFHERKKRNSVVAQNPDAGHRVIEGTRVHLELNRKPDKNGPTYLHGAPGIGLFRYRIASGFLKRRIRVELICFGVSIDLFDGFGKPGEEIWSLIPKDEAAEVILYEDGKPVQGESGWRFVKADFLSDIDLPE